MGLHSTLKTLVALFLGGLCRVFYMPDSCGILWKMVALKGLSGFGNYLFSVARRVTIELICEGRM